MTTSSNEAKTPLANGSARSIQWKGDNIMQVWEFMLPDKPQYMGKEFSNADEIVGVWTPQGLKVAKLGDWITRGSDGSLRVDKNPNASDPISQDGASVSAQTQGVPDKSSLQHETERFALSGQCDNAAHSKCPYPERCKCVCHKTESESSISSKRFAFSPQCDLALGGYCDDGEHSNCSRPDTCKCVCHRLSAVNEIRERRRKMYFASGRPTDGWEHVDTLLGIIDSLKAERDLAIAHDRQPYPTADAYEKVCAALQKHKDDASNMKAAIVKRVREKAGYLDEQANSLVGQSNAYWAGDRRMEARLLTELATELEAVELDDLEVK